MDDIKKKHYSMEFIEENGKTYVLFYDSQDNLVEKKEIPHQDIDETVRLNGHKTKRMRNPPYTYNFFKMSFRFLKVNGLQNIIISKQ
jgi:hypothetical protein